MSDVAIREIEAKGLCFRSRVAGDEAGEPVMLLHGFPETSHMWIALMARLAAQGYRCLAPDQRGYSPGARPEGKAHYTIDELASDVIAIADAAAFPERFHLVGHDWGAGVGWRVVQRHAERLASWTALSVPHPGSYMAGYADPDQRRRGQYIEFFQEPGAAEAAFAENDWALLKAIWSESPPEQVAEYLAVLTEPGALTAALNWYRAAFGGVEGFSDPEGLGGEFDVYTPTLTIWGNQDPAIGRAATLKHEDYMKGESRWVELDAGHWLVQERFEEVTGELLAHLRRHALPRSGRAPG